MNDDGWGHWQTAKIRFSGSIKRVAKERKNIKIEMRGWIGGCVGTQDIICIRIMPGDKKGI